MQDNSPEEPEGEILYTEQNGNKTLTPLQDSQDFQGESSNQQQRPMSIYRTARNDFNNKMEKGQLIADQPLPSLVYIPKNGEEQQQKYEPSPKTINLGSSGEEPEYNIRTLNAKKSPKNLPNNSRVYREKDSGDQNPEQIQYYDDDFQGYAEGTGDSQPNAPGGVMYPRSRSPPPYNQGLDISPYGVKTYEVPPNKLSPNKYYEDTNSSREKGQDPRYTSRNNIYGSDNNGFPRQTMPVDDRRRQAPLLAKSNTNPQKDEITNKYNDKTYNTSYRDVKKIAGRFAKIYDPNRNENGILLGEQQVTVPGAYDEVFNNRYRVLSKMNRLSNILLAKQKRSPERYEGDLTQTRPAGRDTSFNEGTKKTFNRKTFNESGEERKKRRPYSRSPDHKFLYVSLAMISSKGPTCEDRTILRRMRLEKGGVVDLAQEDKKKNRFKITKATPKKGGTRGYSYANPKFREKAARIIQEWWRDLKILYNDRLKKIIKIQSVWRGKFVRKYMYDLFYLNFLYISFCKKIESVLSKHVRPYVFDKLMQREKEEVEEEEEEEIPEDKNVDRNRKLKKILRKDYRNIRKILLPYWKKWLEEVKKNNNKNQKSRNLVQIRADKENKQNDLKNAFDKWRYITKLLKTKEETEENKKLAKDLLRNKSQDVEKIKGLFKIVDGLDKLTKKDAMENVVPKLEEYLKNHKDQKKLKKIVDKKPDYDKELLRKYLYQWYANSLLDKDESIINGINEEDDERFREVRGRVFLNKVDNFEKKRDRNILRKYFNKFFRKSVQLALEDDRRKSVLKENEDKQKENDLQKDYENQIEDLNEQQKVDQDEIDRLRNELKRLSETEEEEEVEIVRKFAEDKDLLSRLEGWKILRRAVWRITHKDPLHAFDEKLTWEKLMELLRKMVHLRGNKDDDLLRRAFDKWRDKTFKINKDLLKKMFAKLALMSSEDYLRNLLRKKFNQWRRNCREEQEEKDPFDCLKTCKNLMDLMDLIKKIYIDHYGDEFLEKLDRYRNPYRKVRPLRSLYNRKDKDRKNLLRNALNKWRYNCKDERIRNLIKHTLYRIYEKNCTKDWEILNLYFQRWKKITNEDLMKRLRNRFDDQNRKNKIDRNQILKQLVNEYNRHDDKNLLQKYFNRWKSMVEPEPTFVNLDEDKKKTLLRNLLNKRTKEEDLTLLEYLLRWRNKMLEMQRKGIPLPYRKAMLSIMLTKNDKDLLRKYFDRWRYSGLMKIPIMCYIVGQRLLKRALIRKPFKDFCKKMHETDPKVLGPKGKKLFDVLKKLVYGPLKDFFKKLKKYIKIKALRETQPKIHDIVTDYYLKKYLYRWLNNTVGDREMRQNSFIEWIIKMRREDEINRIRRKKELLKRFIDQIENKDARLLTNALRKFLKNAKLDERIEDATTIEKFCRGALLKIYRKNEEASDNLYNLFLELYKKYLIKKLLEAAKGIPKKEVVREKPQPRATRPIPKDYSGVRRAVEDMDDKFNRDLLKYYFNKWRRFYDLCDANALLIQRYLRALFAKSRYDKMKKFYDFLLNSFLNKDRNAEDLLRQKFFLWLLNKKKIDRDENSTIIQKFCHTKLNKYLHNKLINFLVELAKKYAKHLIDNAAKVDKLNKALRHHPLKDALDEIGKYGRLCLIRKALIKILANYDDDMKRLLLKYYLDLWRKKVNEMKRKEEEAAIEIQKVTRGYLLRKYFKRNADKFKKLLALFLKADVDPNELLKATLRKWRKKVKEIDCENNATIIQKFCRSIQEKINIMNEEKMKELYIKLVEIIMGIKANPREFFDRLKLIRRNQILKEFVDALERKRKDHLQYAMDKLKGVPKSKYIRGLMGIPDNVMNRFLKKYFDLWKEKTFRYKMIQEILRSIVSTIDNKKEYTLRQSLAKWLYHAIYRRQDHYAYIIQDFCRGILDKIRARKNWRKLSNRLLGKKGDDDSDEIIKKLRYLFGLEKLKKPIVRHVRKEVLSLFDLFRLYKLFLDRMRKIVLTRDQLSNEDLLRKYFNIWRNNARKLKEREEGMGDLVDVLEKLRRKKTTPYVEYSSIIKRLFDLIPLLQALCCLRRLRNYANLNGNNNALANDLIKAKEEIEPQNKDKLIKKLIKVYAYKVLKKFFDDLERLRREKALYIMREFLEKLYKNFIKHSELNYIGQKENENQPVKTKTSFRLRKTNPDKISSKKLTYVTLTPHLVKYLEKIFKKYKQMGFDALKGSDDADRFCKLYKKWVELNLLKPKRDLIDNLKATADSILSEGPLQEKLYKLLRHYGIKKMLENKEQAQRLVALKYLIKLIFMSKKIADNRWVRNLIRRWRYIAFSRKLAANKMKRIYKNLHSSYLEISNCLFGEELKGASGRSVIKEFERLGTDIGIWENEKPEKKEEEKFCKEIKTQYVFTKGEFPTYYKKVSLEEEKDKKGEDDGKVKKFKKIYLNQSDNKVEPKRTKYDRRGVKK